MNQPRRTPVLWRAYRSLHPVAQIAGAVAFLAFLAFFCSAAAAGVYAGITGASPGATSSPALQVNRPETPTPRLTHAPRVTPTRAPAPTPRPVLQPTPSPVPTHLPVPIPTPKPSCNAVNGNPWCYNFTPGNVIYNPPSTFCDYFNCIASFWNGNGYVIECQDGEYSQSGGIQGSCSRHGGDLRPLYSH